jgi:zinc protease
MYKHLRLALFATCLATPVVMPPPMALAAQEAPAEKVAEDTRTKVFNAERFELDNGMEVVVIPNDRAPVITHMVWYKVGAAMEPQGKSGIAHFLEHLMFKGSKQIGGEYIPAGEFSKTIRRLGGQDNAFTAQDYTAYFQSVPSSELETVMRMEAGRMRGMLLPRDEVLAERSVIMEERRQRTDNNPQARFIEQFNAHSYINHPYGTPVIGWMHEIEKLSWQDAKNYYAKWYAPNNAILVVSGDVTPADVFAKAIDTYGTIRRYKVPEREYTQSPPMESRPQLVMRDKAVREPMLYKAYRAPSTRQNKEESLALEVLAEIMGGGPTSRLYKSLVSEQKIASSAGLSYDSSQWDDAGLSLYAVPLPGQDPFSMEAALDEEMRKLAAKGVSDDELSDAITRMRDRAAFARDSLSGPAMIIGRALASGSSLDDVEYWPYDIADVTAQRVQTVAQTYLDPDRKLDIPAVVGVLLPADKDEK